MPQAPLLMMFLTPLSLLQLTGALTPRLPGLLLLLLSLVLVVVRCSSCPSSSLAARDILIAEIIARTTIIRRPRIEYTAVVANTDKPAKT